VAQLVRCLRHRSDRVTPSQGRRFPRRAAGGLGRCDSGPADRPDAGRPHPLEFLAARVGLCDVRTRWTKGASAADKSVLFRNIVGRWVKPNCPCSALPQTATASRRRGVAPRPRRDVHRTTRRARVHRRPKSKAGMPAIADAATARLVVVHHCGLDGINLCHSVSPLRATAAVRAKGRLHRFRLPQPAMAAPRARAAT
jgi:hypothetical protein